ncbi:MAG TPA: sugar phosphate isomerase/epimerase family protein [Bryobacteraceae bacterium]|nr:sugar phosphate isomerase/epimerase family protein [Bryobacteraceae bacterium]
MALLHSVSYSGTWGHEALPLEAFVDRAADLGYDGVMLMAKRPHLSVLDWNHEACLRLKERLEARKMRTICVAGYTNFTADLEHTEVPMTEIQIQHVTDLARMARDLGGSLVRVFTGYENPSAPYLAEWALLVRALRECARRAADYGVTIAVQNHHDVAADYESQFDLIEEVDHPNCRAAFDAWAPALHGVDLERAAEKMGRITVLTTAANYNVRRRYHLATKLTMFEPILATARAVPIDEGFIDYNAFFDAMGRAGFRGAVTFEMCSPLRGGGSLENLDRYARRFVEFMSHREKPALATVEA